MHLHILRPTIQTRDKETLALWVQNFPAGPCPRYIFVRLETYDGGDAVFPESGNIGTCDCVANEEVGLDLGDGKIVALGHHDAVEGSGEWGRF
jgi:hypothetical protein